MGTFSLLVNRLYLGLRPRVKIDKKNIQVIINKILINLNVVILFIYLFIFFLHLGEAQVATGLSLDRQKILTDLISWKKCVVDTGDENIEKQGGK